MSQKKIPDITPATATGFLEADDNATAATIALRDSSGNLAMNTAVSTAIANSGWTSLGQFVKSSSFVVDESTNTGTTFGLNNASAGITTTLEATSSVPGKLLIFYKSDSSANVGTISPNGGDTIGGAPNFILYNQGDSVGIQSNGAGNWIVLFTHKSEYGPLANAIVDPGNTGAIPVNRSGYCNIVTGGAETRTIAAPTVEGQQLLLVSKTHVGNAVVTVASTINSTGNNTITISAAGQNILLAGVISGSTLRWMVVANDGTALSTV